MRNNMRNNHRIALLAVPALLALTSCGIPATGVVEAGSPASGIRPVTPLYFVRSDALVAVPRITTSPGDPEVALNLLLLGPTSAEALGISTNLPVQQAAEPARPPTAEAGLASEAVRQPDEDQEATVDPTDGTDSTAEVASRLLLDVSVKKDTVTIVMAYPVEELPDLAAGQLICTAAGAHRVGTPSADVVTVELTDHERGQKRGTDKDCPRL
ncbi:hypothetical protein ACWD25_13250 [Streptomyces sp. NPDC002920]